MTIEQLRRARVQDEDRVEVTFGDGRVLPGVVRFDFDNEYGVRRIRIEYEDDAAPPDFCSPSEFTRDESSRVLVGRVVELPKRRRA